MKQSIVALVATAAYTGSALAADMATKAQMRAAPVAYAPLGAAATSACSFNIGNMGQK
jgi:hypothetical protein